MRLEAILNLTAWPFRRLAIVVVAVQSGVVFLHYFNTMLSTASPFLELLGIVSVLVLPGALIIRLLGIRERNHWKMLLYVVALSIFFVYTVGATINFVYPAIGISSPFSRTPLIATTSACVGILLAACFLVERKRFSEPIVEDIRPVDGKGTRVASVFTICLGLVLVLTSVAGTLIANYTHSYSLMFILFGAIATVPLIVLLDGRSARSYAFLIFSVSLSLLFSHSLMSLHITGFDTNVEYFYANEVLRTGVWNPSIESDANGLLSVVVLPPVLSIVCGQSLAWVYKFVFSLLFSLVPLGVYLILEKQVGRKASFLACLLLVFGFSFYEMMPQLPRQEIAELFFVAVFLLYLDGSAARISNKFLLIVFGICVGLSHYVILYVFAVIMLGIIVLNRKHGLPRKTIGITTTYALLLVVASLAWYFSISGAGNFNNFVDFLSSIVATFGDWTTSGYSGVSAVTATTSMTRQITMILHLFSIAMIAVGLARCLQTKRMCSLSGEYLKTSIATALFAFFAFTTTYVLAFSMTARMEHFVLLILGAFFIVGIRTCSTFSKSLPGLNRIGRRGSSSDKNGIAFASTFLLVFFLFNSGFVYEIADDNPNSIALSNDFDYPSFSQGEVVSAQWLANHKEPARIAYADEFRSLLLYGYITKDEVKIFQWSAGQILPMSTSDICVYLGSYNLRTNEIRAMDFLQPYYMSLDETTLYRNLKDTSRVYSNGQAEIYCG